MADPCVKYAIAFCLVALALFHVHDCAETGIGTSRVDKGYEKDGKDIANNDVKISNGCEVEKRRKGDGCVLEAPFNGEFLWCCVYGDPNEQRCYDTRTECRGECNRFLSKTKLVEAVHQLNP